jgi:hypothetical protein
MFDLGRKEALSWAQEAGFPAALARKDASKKKRRLTTRG